jgi:mono/diheme cytochrome c family protein
MLPRALPFAFVTALTLTITNTHAGGWAVVTVENLPEQFVVGKPTTLTFSVRQHGQRLVPGLRAHASANLRDKQIDANAGPGKESGYYTASFTLPEPGQWSISIQSGFGASGLTLMPIEAVAASAVPTPVPIATRGQQLFIAKGCNTCHAHGDSKARPMSPVGVDLTDKRYTDGLLAKILQDPSIVQPTGTWRMPNLNLKPQEISALVAFINKPRTRP